jgi:hypothetical protein
VALHHTSDWRAEEAEKDGAEGAGLETLAAKAKSTLSDGLRDALRREQLGMMMIRKPWR